MDEAAIIAALRGRLPCAGINGALPGLCDAEVTELEGLRLAVSCDEFSAEDAFRVADRERLGWNLGLACFDDLLAVGADPRCFVHALAVPPEWTAADLEALGAGLAAAAAAVGARCLGGDVGRAGEWRWTGTVIGILPNGVEARTRRLVGEAGVLWVSGPLGGGNLAAAGGCDEYLLADRCQAAAVLREHQVPTAMDTSDGLLRSLEAIATLNRGYRLELDLDVVPYVAGAVGWAAGRRVPLPVLLAGGAGEYELLAAGPAELPGFLPIGRYQRAGRTGLWLRQAGSCHHHRTVPDPRADAAGYRDALLAWGVALAAELRP